MITEISEGERTEKDSQSESNVSVVSNIDSEAAKVSTTTDNGEVQYGDRLLDDLMNTFCDRLQAACPRKIDGCLAIQFVLVEPQALKSLVSVDRPAHQIIFDPDRVHYVVVDYDPKAKLVVLYDSLVEKDSNVANLLTEPIRKQVSALFSHVFTNNAIYVAISRSYDRQTDTWSCGYRSIACMVDLARQRNPCDTTYCMKSIYNFFQKVINDGKTAWEEFESACFGEARQNNDNAVTIVRLYPDLVFEEIACRFTTASSHEPSGSELGIQKCSLRSPITTVSTIDVDTKSEDSVKCSKINSKRTSSTSPDSYYRRKISDKPSHHREEKH